MANKFHFSARYHSTITPGTAATITADVADADKSLPILKAGTHVIVSTTFVDRATVIVQPTVTARPHAGGRQAGLVTTKGTMRTVPLNKLEPIANGWQLFEPGDPDRSV